MGVVASVFPWTEKGDFAPSFSTDTNIASLSWADSPRKALLLALQEGYLQGISSRNAKHITHREACIARLCGVE